MAAWRPVLPVWENRPALSIHSSGDAGIPAVWDSWILILDLGASLDTDADAAQQTRLSHRALIETPPMDVDAVRQGLGSWASWQQPPNSPLRGLNLLFYISAARGRFSSSFSSAVLCCLSGFISSLYSHHVPCARDNAVNSLYVACTTFCVSLVVILECWPGLSRPVTRYRCLSLLRGLLTLPALLYSSTEECYSLSLFRTFFRLYPRDPLLRTMRQQLLLPEMVHSSTYYRDGAQHRLMTGFLPESSSSSSPSAPATTPVPTRSTTPPLSPPTAARLPEAASGHRYSHSNPYQFQHRHHPYNHRSLPGESMGSGPEPPPPVSLVESDSIVTRGSNGTSRTTRKERVRESLSGHSSYMSGEQRRHHGAPSASRTPKQPLHEEAPVPDANQDALVMLVSSCDRKYVKQITI